MLLCALFTPRASAQRVAPDPVVVQVLSAADGKPLPGVRVQVGTRYATTTLEGIATLDGMPAGAVPVIIEQVGFERHASQLMLAPGRRESVDVHLTPVRRARLSGVVLLEDTGLAVPGCRLRLDPTSVAAAVQGPFDFTTDWEGKFAILELPPGRYRCSTRMGGCLDGAFALQIDGDTEGVELVVQRDVRPASLAVDVTDADTGAPISGATVALAEAFPSGTIARAVTDAQGRATFEKLRVGRPNSADDTGSLKVSGRRVTLWAGAQGYAETTTVLGLHEGAVCQLTLASSSPVPEGADNDTWETAEPLLVGRPVELTVAPTADKDFFRFRLPLPSFLDVTLGPGVPFENVIELFDRESKLIASQVGYSKQENRLVRGLPAGEYVVAVAQRYGREGSPEPLRLLVSATVASDALEPNDAPGAARLVHAGESLRGTILPSGDRDHYRFELKRPGTVRITRGPHPLESVLELLDSAGSVRHAAIAYPGKAGELIAPLDAGWHTFVHRHRYDSVESTEPYLVILDCAEDDLLDDPAEGRGPLQARHAAALAGIRGATLNPVGDVDRFAVAVPSAGRLRMRLASPTEAVFQVRAASGQVLASAIAYAGKPAALDWSAPGPMVGYLEVRGRYERNWSLAPYTLETFFEPADEAERMGANDTAQSATPFEPGDVLRGSVNPIGDVDWYRIGLNHPSHLTIEGVLPLESIVTLYGESLEQLASVVFYAAQPSRVEADLLSGTSLVSIQQRYGSSCEPADYELRTTLDFADRSETEPLATDAPRRLVLGEARSFRIDHRGDRDRFLIDVPQAGTYMLRVHAPIECAIQVIDDRSQQEFRPWIAYPRTPLEAQLQLNGPTRLRLEIEHRYGSQRSSLAGFVEVGPVERKLVAARMRAETEPTDPARVVLTPEPIAELAEVSRILVDADGDGSFESELPVTGGAIRYASEGIYPATFLFEGPGGARSRLDQWVQAVGPRERTGVHLAVDHPAQGHVVEDSRPAQVRAISYEGTPIASVSASIAGRVVASRHAPPFLLELPWESFGPGQHEIEFLAQDRRGHQARLERSFSVSEYFGLQPEDGAVLSGDDVFVSWRGTSFGPAVVRYRKSGEEQWTDVIGESGRRRRVRIGDLETGVPYELQPLGASEPGPTRTISRVQGLAFGRARYAATIARDYDQRLAVSVRNHAEEALTLSLRAGTPEGSQLLVGFVGEGSQGEPLVLEAGEEREFWLGLSAQDVIRAEHVFPVRITSESGLADEAEVTVRVRLPRVELEWEDLGPVEHGIGRRLRLTNRGDPITDLRVESLNPGVFLAPAIEHGLLPAGRSISMDAQPVLHEGFERVETVVAARAVGTSVELPLELSLGEGERVFAVPLSATGAEDPVQASLHAARLLAGYYLNPDSVDWSAPSTPEDTDGDGRSDRFHQDDEAKNVLWTGEDGDGDGVIDFVHADLGRDGQYDYSAFRMESGWERTNLVEAWLEMNFLLPWRRGAYEPHDVDVLFNGSVVGSIHERIPEGNYTFRLPPRLVKFDDIGAPAGNHLEIRSEHLRGGHYVVTSDFRIQSRLIGTRAWTIARSREEAADAARSQPGLSVSGADYAVSSSEIFLAGVDQGTIPAAGSELEVSARVRNLGATRTRSVDVALFRSDPGKQGVELARTTIEGVPLSAAAMVSLPWVASAGDHVLSVVVDPDGRSGDTQRSNNVAQMTLAIAGDDAPPALEIVAPEAGQQSERPLVELVVDASDDTAVARVEARVDAGAWRDLERSAEHFRGIALLQPGTHTLTVRATDSGGHRVESLCRVTVTAARPRAELLAPEESAVLEARSVVARVRVDETAALVAARVSGGPWSRLAIEGTLAEGELALAFGAGELEVAVIDGSGAMTLLRRSCSSTVQPEGTGGSATEAGEQAQRTYEPLRLMLEGAGWVPVLDEPNAILPATSSPAGAGDSVAVPEALLGSSLVYACTHSELYLTVELDGARLVARSATPTGEGRREFSATMTTGRASAGEPSSSIEVQTRFSGDESQGQVHGIFYADGREAELVWLPDDGQLQWTRWVRVAEIGAHQPLSEDTQGGR
jgi:hypothetical protein